MNLPAIRPPVAGRASLHRPLRYDYLDATALPSRSYVYTVKAVQSGTASAASSGDLATTVILTDDPAIAGTTRIRALHITQLQSAVNAVRTAAGLPALTFASVTSGTIVAAVHIEELRAALDPARSALGLPGVTYTRRPLAAGQLIKAYDLNETRRGVQ